MYVSAHYDTVGTQARIPVHCAICIMFIHYIYDALDWKLHVNILWPKYFI